MKSFNRTDRISQQIKRELADILQRGDLKDDRIGGLVTITHVEVSGDLRNVKVFFSVFGEEDQRVGTLAALDSAKGFLRGEICRRLGIKFAPEIIFRLDDSLEKGQKITELLDKISKNEI